MKEHVKTVEWVGGPFDRKRFKVPSRQPTIHVRLDDKGKDFDLPIICRKAHYYVVWVEPES